MNKPEPLSAAQLFRTCNPAQFTFTTTAELADLDDVIGQARALSAIRFGIGISHEGFNLFALGPNGTGKHTAVRQFLQQKAPQMAPPADWCYVYNFEQPHMPRALCLPAGQAAPFREAMKHLIEGLSTVLAAAFSSEEYQARKKAIAAEMKERETRALAELKEKALVHNITLVRTPAGFAFAPVRAGEVVGPDEFLRLSPAEQQQLEAAVGELQEALQNVLMQIPQWQRDRQRRLKQLNEEVAAYAVKPHFEELQAAYAELPDVLGYLTVVRQDVIENVDQFLNVDDAELPAGLETAVSDAPPPTVTRYRVNVMVDHSQTVGAPVVFEDQPTYNNLIGRVEHVSQMGALLTDFTLIKPGTLHRANGGYLVLDARKLLLQPYAWEGLKRALRARAIRIESLGHMFSWISTVSLEPEPIPLSVKVILLGERLLYYLLCQYDPDFDELFKVAADFEDEMVRDGDNNLAYARLIGMLARKEGLRHFERTAVARVIEESARLAGDAERLSTHMQSVSDLLREASYWAGEDGRDIVLAGDVNQALVAQRFRAGRIRERLQEMVLRETILIDTDGAQVGQINGLSVSMLGKHSFGRPSRITARVRLGKGEVIDIERQVEMGGPIHSKGVLILAGFLGARFAADQPFSLSATLVFEQSYSGVDGDSASSAELYALLSALSDAPLRQDLAVTGSINQHGQVQAIGGVNEKIEGFFELCQARGLTGSQGVLIPAANVKNLMLHAEVVAAVAAGRFHIYPVSHVDEGIELLTGLPAGERLDDAYPAASINGRVQARLAALAEKQRAFAGPAPAANGQLAAVTNGAGQVE